MIMDWIEENVAEGQSALVKEFKFKDFVGAWAFMNSVALVAEKMDHHPNWCNVYNHVIIRLSTHDAGNKITDKDRKLAAEIDKLSV